MTESEEYYEAQLKERGWRVGKPKQERHINGKPYGPYWFYITHIPKNLDRRIAVRPDESYLATAYGEALRLESEHLRDVVQEKLYTAFREAARLGTPLHFDIPPEWIEAQQLNDVTFRLLYPGEEDTPIEELRQRSYDEIKRINSKLLKGKKSVR